MTIPSKFRLFFASTALALLISCSDNPSLRFPTEAEFSYSSETSSSSVVLSSSSSSSSSEFSSASEQSSSSSSVQPSSSSILPSSSSNPCANFVDGNTGIKHEGIFKQQLCDSRDGKRYVYVDIGKQTWMAQNLDYDVEGSLYYKDDSGNTLDNCGKLYTWSMAMKLDKTCDDSFCKDSIIANTHRQGVCPDGWHLPDTTELRILINSVGNSAKELKAKSGWEANIYKPDFGNGIDTYGFTAQPCGAYDSGTMKYSYYRTQGSWMATIEVDKTTAYDLSMSFDDDNITIGKFTKKHSYNVRCIKDN